MEIPEDEQGKKGDPIFIGVISQRDLYRYVSPYWGTLAEREEDANALRRRLADVVTRKPKSAPPDMPVEQVLGLMADLRIDIVPIVAFNRLVGLITAGDIVKAVAIMGRLKQFREARKDTGARRVRLIDMLGDTDNASKPSFSSAVQSVQDIMAEQVINLSPKDPLKKALEVMQKGKFRHVPVLEEGGRLVGLVSDRDVLLRLPPPTPEQLKKKSEEFRDRLFAVDENDPSLRTPLEEVMKMKVVSISPGATLFEAANLLQAHRIGCLPVLDEKGMLQGMLTTRDLIRWLRTAYRMMDKG
jgi:CBS domain-containing protein